MALKIRLKIGGVDRQDRLREREWSIENNAYGDMDIAGFVIHDPDLSLSLVGFEEVIIENFNDASDRRFGGVLIQPAVKGDGALGRNYTCKALDWTFVLERAIASGTYRGRPDDEIINGATPPSGSDQGIFLISDTTLTDFNATTNIQQGVLNTQFMQFKRKSVREIMDMLADQAGYVWYVDPNKAVHFKPFAAEMHTFGLSDESDSVTTFPFYGAQRVPDLSQYINAVTVEGGFKAKNDQTVIYSGNGVATKFSGLAMWQAKSGQTRILVDKNTGTDGAPVWTAQDVGLKGNANDEAAFGVTIEVLWNPGARVLEWAVAPSNLTNSYRISGDQLIPLVHKEVDEAGILLYGREYGHSVKDETLKDEESVVFRAQADMRKYSLIAEKITCRTLKDGVTAGKCIQLKWNVGLVTTPRTFLVEKVVTHLLGGQVAEYDLTLAGLPS